jgi:hypothetical protein
MGKNKNTPTAAASTQKADKQPAKDAKKVTSTSVPAANAKPANAKGGDKKKK